MPGPRNLKVLYTRNFFNLIKWLYIDGAVVVITGASSGIGKEIAFRYAERGCRIVIGARNIKELQKVSVPFLCLITIIFD